MRLRSTLRDVLALHYRVPAAPLRPLVDGAFQLEQLEGNAAAVSLLLFRHTSMRPAKLPVPGCSFAQMNCRTYVQGASGKPEAYFLRIAVPRWPARIARIFGLDCADLKLRDAAACDDPSIRVRCGLCDGEYWHVEIRPGAPGSADSSSLDWLNVNRGYVKNSGQIIQLDVRHDRSEARACQALRVMLPARFNPAGLSNEELRRPMAAAWIDRWEIEASGSKPQAPANPR
ncbi:MAG: DUF2071 domain-containing protein [Acidobacteriota bacterium]